jgi:hypothetical protein
MEGEDFRADQALPHHKEAKIKNIKITNKRLELLHQFSQTSI